MLTVSFLINSLICKISDFIVTVFGVFIGGLLTFLLLNGNWKIEKEIYSRFKMELKILLCSMQIY